MLEGTQEAGPFETRAGLPLLGGAECLEAFASALEDGRPKNPADAACIAKGLREVAAVILSSVAALRSSGAGAEMREVEAGWQPIETAPKDGTDILLGSEPQTYQGKPVPARVTVGHWTSDEECREQIGDCGGECRCPEYKYHDPYWMTWDGGFTAENPATKWMPLPALPLDGGRS